MKIENNELSLNLSEFRVVSKQIKDSDCVFEVVPIKEPTECPECLSNNFVKNGSYNRFVRDLNSFEYSIGIRILDNRYLCRSCNKHFVPDYLSIAPKSRLTERLVDKIKTKVFKNTFSHIADEYKVTVPTIKKIFNDYADDLERGRVIWAPTVLGIDEAHLNKNIRGVLVDVENHLVIEMLPKRNKNTVVEYFNSYPNGKDIKVVTMDMCNIYKEAVLECFPSAKIVVDRFHVIKLLTNALNEYKNALFKLANNSKNFNARTVRQVLLGNLENLKEKDITFLNELFIAYPELQVPYSLKEEFRHIYDAPSRKTAEEAYKGWCDKLSTTSNCFAKVKETVDRWHEYIFNYFDYRYTNGITESLNNVIKSLERAGRGYTFEVLRAKVLFSNSASKPAKFHFTKSGTRNDFDINRMSMMSFISIETPTKIIEVGSGTDIFELQELINNNEL